MNHAQEVAFEAALQIVVSYVADSKSVTANEAGGRAVGEFFTAVYDKLLEITSKKD